MVGHYGPVPVWLHAAADRLFGLRFATPLVLLVPLAAVTLFSLYALVRRAAGPLAAFSATLLGTAVALVAPNGGALVFPYSFPAAHALAYSTLALALSRYRSRTADVACALLWGLAFASKVEYALVSIAAALAADCFGVAGRWCFPRRVAVRALAAFGIGLGTYGVAFRGLPLASLTLEGPLVLFDPPVEWRRVYRIVSGLDDPGRSLAAVATAVFLSFALLVAVEAGTRLGRRVGTPPAVVAFSLAAAAVVVVLLGTEAGRALDRGLPPALRAGPAILACLALLVAVRRIPATPPLVALIVVGTLGAARVALFFSYGWSATPYSALVAPGVVAASAAAAFVLLPGRSAFLAVAFVALAALQAGRVGLASDPTRLAELRTERGTLRLRPDKARALGQALAYLSARTRQGDTLAGFPEAGFFNFALGLPNPLRQDQILPGHLDAVAEESTIRRLREREPRFVVLVNQPSPAFGPSSFGNDYAVRLWKAVLEGWQLRASFGEARPDEPVGTGPFFVRIYERRGQH